MISSSPSKEVSDPELFEWVQQNPMDQEDEEDCEEDYDTLPEVVFLTWAKSMIFWFSSMTEKGY